MAEIKFYTPEGFKALQDELEYLRTVRVEENKKEISTARSFGDLSENSEYDEAKAEQGQIHARIAELDEMSYRRELWDHRPLTDFWRVGKGYSKKLEDNGFYTMGDIARASLNERMEDRLYKLFGVNAELLIDHAWGHESCTMKDIKKYKPENNSLGAGQVLMEPYTYEKAKVVLKEMVDNLCLDLVEKGLVTDVLYNNPFFGASISQIHTTN